MEFVSWGYYSQLNGKIEFMFQTTNHSSNFTHCRYIYIYSIHGGYKPTAPSLGGLTKSTLNRYNVGPPR